MWRVADSAFGRDEFLDDFANEEIFDDFVLRISSVLGRDYDVGDAHGLAVFVLNRNLAFRVGAEPFDFAGFADASQFAAETVGEHDRSGHQFFCFIAGETEHQPLVARPLIHFFFLICT